MIKVELVHCNNSIEDQTDEGSVRDNPNACIVVANEVLLKMTEDDAKQDNNPSVMIEKSQVSRLASLPDTEHKPCLPSCLGRRSVTSITVHAKCPFTRECILH